MMSGGSVPVDGGHLRLRLFIYQEGKRVRKAPGQSQALVGWNMAWQLTASKLNERGIVFTESCFWWRLISPLFSVVWKINEM